MIIMEQWTWVENNNEVLLRVTNHTGQAEKILLGPAGIRTRDLRFTSPMLYQLSYRSSWELVVQDVVFDGVTSQRQTQSKMATP